LQARVWPAFIAESPPMSKSFKEITHDLNGAIGKFKSANPDTMSGFNAMSKGAMQPGVIDALHKELIALAIGVASRCDGCIGFHVKALIRMGMTREQLMETLGVAVYMGGGPSLMYAAETIRAYEELSAS
jgi:AhpD family alkylhydroperoxidase